MAILLFDNYDSFTFNLLHLMQSLTDEQVEVYQNDAISLQEIDRFTRIVLSPGPGIPSEAGLLIPLVKKYGSRKKIFGVCLGQQAIAEAYGGSIYNLPHVYHGMSTSLNIRDRSDYLFRNVAEDAKIGRYHSWAVAEESIKNDFDILATDEEGIVMAIRHKFHDVTGVQFHPESILSSCGSEIMQNWLTH